MTACGRSTVRFAFGRCTARGPTGLQREHAPNTTHTDVRDTRVHQTLRITVLWVDLDGPGLPRRPAGRQRRRAANATHADGRETGVHQLVQILVHSYRALCARHARETWEIIARKQRATSMHARK